MQCNFYWSLVALFERGMRLLVAKARSGLEKDLFFWIFCRPSNLKVPKQCHRFCWLQAYQTGSCTLPLTLMRLPCPVHGIFYRQTDLQPLTLSLSILRDVNFSWLLAWPCLTFSGVEHFVSTQQTFFYYWTSLLKMLNPSLNSMFLLLLLLHCCHHIQKLFLCHSVYWIPSLLSC